MNIFEKQLKCRESFTYFVENYIKICHPVKGLIAPDLYDYQKRLINTYEQDRFVLVKKFRQGGFSTYSLLYALWKCIFFEDQKILFLCGRDSDACCLSNTISRIMSWLPDEVYPRIGHKNDHLIEFPSTKSSMSFLSSSHSFRGREATHIIIDEAAFIADMEDTWKIVWPCISTGGKCFAVSTPNGVGNWYHEQYVNSENGCNKFKIFVANYTENPEYNNPEWVEQTRKALGEKGWRQEVLGEFLGNELDPVAYINNAEMQDRLSELMENHKRRLSFDDIELLQQARFRLGHLEWPPESSEN